MASLAYHMHTDRSASRIAAVLKEEHSNSNVISHDNDQPHLASIRSGRRLVPQQSQERLKADISPIRLNDTYRSTLDFGTTNFATTRYMPSKKSTNVSPNRRMPSPKMILSKARIVDQQENQKKEYKKEVKALIRSKS